jgi:glucokinase
MIKTEHSNTYILTADIGGSHITSAICDIARQHIFPETVRRLEFDSRGSAESILNSWTACLKSSLGIFEVDLNGVGLAMPGPFDYQEGILYIRGLNKFEALYGANIRTELAERLQLRPELFKFRNDAEATIAGEVICGAGSRYDRVLGVTLGTGFGSAFYDGSVTRDINLGSEPFMSTIADDHLSTRWFIKRAFELTGIAVSGVKELSALAISNAILRKIFDEFACNMSSFLNNHLTIYQPQALILCGNIAKASSYFLPELQSRVAIPVMLATLGESAALQGLSELFVDRKMPGLVIPSL